MTRQAALWSLVVSFLTSDKIYVSLVHNTYIHKVYNQRHSSATADDDAVFQWILWFAGVCQWVKLKVSHFIFFC